MCARVMWFLLETQVQRLMWEVWRDVDDPAARPAFRKEPILHRRSFVGCSEPGKDTLDVVGSDQEEGLETDRKDAGSREFRVDFCGCEAGGGVLRRVVGT